MLYPNPNNANPPPFGPVTPINPELKPPAARTPLIRWRADKTTQTWRALRVECPDGLYPARDADGIPIYENTHFESEWACLQRLRGDALSKIQWAGEQVENSKAALIEAEQKAADACLVFAGVARLIENCLAEGSARRHGNGSDTAS